MDNMNLSDAITRVRSLLAETTSGMWTDQEITNWLNEGNKDFHSKKGIKAIWTLAVNANDRTVGTDATMLHINYLYFTPTGGTETYIPPSEYMVYKDRILFTTPIPTDGTLTCYGDRLPNDAVNMNDELEIDLRFEDAIIDYACYRAFEKDQNPGMFGVMYNTYLKQKTEWEKTHFDRGGARIRAKRTW
jgi:hypothetical protein